MKKLILTLTILFCFANTSQAAFTLSANSVKIESGAETGLTLKGVLKVNDGLITAPSWTFTSDTNTGAYLFGADDLSFVTGGANRFFLESTGDIGINTNDPWRLLHIFEGSGGLGTPPLDSSTIGEFLIENSTDVGMTFLSPIGSEQIINFVDNSQVSGGRNAFIQYDDAGVAALEIGTTNLSGAVLSFFVKGTQALTIQKGNDARVGIGITTPSHGLDLVYSATSSLAGTNRGISNAYNRTGIVTTGTDTSTGYFLSFGRTGATGGTINNFGMDLSVSDDGGGTSTNTGIKVNVAGADTNYSGLFTGGNFGIGLLDPDEELEITGRFHLGQTTAPGTTTDKLYNVTGSLFWNGTNLLTGTGLLNIVEDLTPQLGASLDVNSFGFTSTNAALPVTIGTGAGDDFTINTTGFVYEGDTIELGLGRIPSANLDILDTANGIARVNVENADVGVAALSQYRLTNTVSSLEMSQYGIGFTTVGAKIADGSSILHSSGVFGSDLTIGSSAGIRFYTGGITATDEGMRLESDGDVVIGTTTAGADLHIYANNTTTTGNLGFRIEQDGTGDALQNFLLTGGQDYVLGIDNSAADAFIIGPGSDLDTTPSISISTVGIVTFPQGYTRKIIIEAGAASQGSTAPTFTTVGTVRGLSFSANAELAFFSVGIPSDWDGTSNFDLGVHWLPTSGDAIADTETVKFDISYHAAALGEAVDQGTVATATTTYTQSGAGTDKEHLLTMITIPATGGNQPLALGDLISIQFNRDATTDTYSGDPNIYFWTIEYTATGLPEN